MNEIIEPNTSGNWPEVICFGAGKCVRETDLAIIYDKMNSESERTTFGVWELEQACEPEKDTSEKRPKSSSVDKFSSPSLMALFDLYFLSEFTPGFVDIINVIIYDLSCLFRVSEQASVWTVLEGTKKEAKESQ